MLPRFMISIRELYDRDSHRDCQSIDSEFGILSRPATGENQTVPAIGLADVTLGQSAGQTMEGDAGNPEMVALEEIEDGAHQT